MPAEHLGGAPSDWLFRAARAVAPTSAAGPRATTVLASRLAALLRRRPDSEAIGDLPEKLLVQLFYLAAQCQEPDVLWEPLLATWRRHMSNCGARMAMPAVTVAFRVAISRNQGGTELTEAWLDLLRGRPRGLLGFRWIDGWGGLCRQPIPPGCLLPPHLGQGLRVLARTYGNDPKTGLEALRNALERARGVLPSTSTLDHLFARFLIAEGLPPSVAMSLPYRILDPGKDARGSLRALGHSALGRAAEYLPPALGDEVAKLELLTPRERVVLEHIAKGLLANEVGSLLGISPRTVQTHLRNIYEKLHVHSRSEAVSRGSDPIFRPRDSSS